MDKNFEAKYHDLEKTHWWFVGRRNILLSILRNQNKSSEILDIGCSGGDFLLELKKEGFERLNGIDLSSDAIKLCNKKGLKNCYLMDATKIKLKKKFDVIIASDVLEHLNDDSKTVDSWKSLLKEGGRLICFVPAFNFLWSNHDLLNKHFKRYNKKDLTILFEKNNFIIERTSYWNFFLFIPISLIRIFQKIFKLNSSKENLNRTPQRINFMLIRLLLFENYLLNFFNFPFGVSVFLIASNKKVF